MPKTISIFRQARIEKELSQAQIARMFGVSKSAVNQWESGKNRPDQSRLIRLSDVLNINVADLIKHWDNSDDTDQTDDRKKEECAFDAQFRARLVEVRRGLGWPQVRMATALGVSPDAYKKYEIRSAFPMYLLPRLALISGRTLS